MSGTRGLRLALLGIVTLVLLGTAGWLILGPKASGQILRSGEIAYEAGIRAIQEKNPTVALLKFQEARLLAENALKRADEEARSGKKAGPEHVAERNVISAKAFLLKAVAIREEDIAKAAVDGKEVPEVLDTSSGQKFRSFMLISDDAARKDAIGSLRTAAMRLPENADLQNEALRVEVSMTPITWALANRFAIEVLKAKPNDPRALFVKARHEFEQPEYGPNQFSGPPKASDKRDRAQVNEALKFVAKLKQVKDYPLGRTAFLEAQIYRWLADDSTRNGKEADAKRERETLEAFLFEDKTGALARLKAGEGFKNVSIYDVDGIVGLHLMALDLAVEQQRKTGEALGKVKQALTDTFSVYQVMDKLDPPVFTADSAHAFLISALAKTQSVLSTEGGKEWKSNLDLVRASLKKSLDKNVSGSAAVADFAFLLQREALVSAKAGDDRQADALRKEALTWVEEGLASHEKRKSPTPPLDLHILAAEMKYSADGKRDRIEPHLQVLRDSRNPQAKAITLILTANALEREGRLEKARKQFEDAIEIGGPEVKLKANMALTNIYLALGLPQKALESLDVVAKVFDGFENLTPQEKEWARLFLRGPDDLSVMLIAANLDTARQNITRYTKQAPGKAVPGSLFNAYEKAALGLIAKLPKQKAHSLQARQALVRYYAAVGRADLAEKELTQATSDHPDSTALLQLNLALMINKAVEKARGKLTKEQTDELQENVDKRIQQFISQFPEDRGGRVLWVTWLSQSGRNDQALEYLNSPKNFPGAKDNVTQRLLASILVSKGETTEASKVLQQMPQNPLIDAMLIQLAGSDQEKSKSIQSAMARYVGNGLFRVFNGELALSEKRYPDAAREFFSTLDFTQVRNLGQNGLQRSLIALAGDDPTEARKLITDMLKEYPTEPALLLPYAVASLNLDDIGAATDNWETVKNMASALDAWEQSMLRVDAKNRPATTFTKAELWTRSNYPEVARVQVLRALEHNPADPFVLSLIIRLDTGLARVAEARKYLQALKKVAPDAITTTILEANIEVADGRARKAIELLENGLAKHPNAGGDAYRSLISILVKEKESAKAMQWSETWIKYLPDDLNAQQELITQMTLWKKDPAGKKKADEFIESALKEVKKVLDKRKYADVKDPEKKRQEQLKDARHLLELRFAQAFLRGQDPVEAERRLHSIVRENPKATTAWMVLGEIYLERRSWKETINAYEKVLELEKANLVAANNLAWVFGVELNDAAKALELLRTVTKGHFSGKALPGDRLNPELLDTLGVVYRKLDKADLYKEMGEIFEAGRKRYPRDPRMYLHLGFAHAGKGENANALQMFNSAIALANDKEIAISPTQRESVIREAEEARKKLMSK